MFCLLFYHPYTLRGLVVAHRQDLICDILIIPEDMVSRPGGSVWEQPALLAARDEPHAAVVHCGRLHGHPEGQGPLVRQVQPVGLVLGREDDMGTEHLEPADIFTELIKSISRDVRLCFFPLLPDPELQGLETFG